jgi:hypothetical protein
MERSGQPAELATIHVMLADPLSSHVSGATIAVTGGGPMLLLSSDLARLTHALSNRRTSGAFARCFRS